MSPPHESLLQTLWLKLSLLNIQLILYILRILMFSTFHNEMTVIMNFMIIPFFFFFHDSLSVLGNQRLRPISLLLWHLNTVY